MSDNVVNKRLISEDDILADMGITDGQYTGPVMTYLRKDSIAKNFFRQKERR